MAGHNVLSGSTNNTQMCRPRRDHGHGERCTLTAERHRATHESMNVEKLTSLRHEQWKISNANHYEQLLEILITELRIPRTRQFDEVRFSRCRIRKQGFSGQGITTATFRQFFRQWYAEFPQLDQMLLCMTSYQGCSASTNVRRA